MPLTPGLTVRLCRFHRYLHLLQLGQEGKVPLKSAQVLFDVSEKAKKILESYFHLETPLYFSYTHLVCRSAIDGTPEHTHTHVHMRGDRKRLTRPSPSRSGVVFLKSFLSK